MAMFNYVELSTMLTAKVIANKILTQSCLFYSH